MLTLWINGHKADINNETLILFNYALDDITNPAVVRNSYSQKVKLPDTPANNAIFKHASRVDSKFNALQKLDFVITNEQSDILQSGYAKMEGYQGGIYEVTLYGKLGSFFYSFSTKEDGSAMNLADIVYLDQQGNPHLGPDGDDTEVSLDRYTLQDVFSYQTAAVKPSVVVTAPWCNFVTFAPARNGKPDNFDTKKVRVAYDSINDGNNLAACATDKTEWEVRDLRTYLQRPAVSVKAVFDSVVSASEGQFEYTASVGALIEQLWLTMSMPKRPTADNPYMYSMRSWFDGTISPTQLMLDVAKTFGLMFYVNIVGEITLMTRAEFYADKSMVDISERIDYGKDLKMTALNFDAKYYVWSNSVVNEDSAKDYTDTFGKTYGEQLVNTGYDFAEGRKKVLESMKIKSAVMVNKSSAFNFQALSGLHDFSPARYESVKLTKSDGTSIDYEYNGTNIVNYNVDKGSDVCELAQLGKDGTNVLLYYAGRVPLSALNDRGWYVSDDDQDVWAQTYNEGVPCWVQYRGTYSGTTRLYNLPLFSRYDRRMVMSFDPTYKAVSLDFAESKAIYFPRVNILTGAHYVYADHWRSYISDRYDALTRALTCRVNLRGMKVGPDLFRRFYWFDNAVWALNKVTNHSLTTADTTECEFIKVQDVNNYK